MGTTSDIEAIDGAVSDGKRVAHRHKVFLPVRMTTSQGDSRIHLINVSATGALAHQATPPIRGTSVGIAFGGGTVAGRIVWVDGQRFGIAFSDRLSEPALRSLFDEHEPPRPTAAPPMSMPRPVA